MAKRKRFSHLFYSLCKCIYCFGGPLVVVIVNPSMCNDEI